jgi:hypothetical protein
MTYDLNPLQSLETKRQWLPRILKGQWIAVFGHDPEVPAATFHEHKQEIEIAPLNLIQ